MRTSRCTIARSRSECWRASLWTTAGKTPWSTVNARLAVDIKNLGSASRFVRAGRGLFALNPDVAGEPPSVDHPRPPAQRTNGAAADSLSFTDAAERVLSQSSNREPLHYTAITQRALERRPDSHRGSHAGGDDVLDDPDRDPAQREARGDSPRFVQHGRGMVGLAAWLPVEVAGLIEEKNREVRRSLLDRARSASPADFENLVGELLAAMGFEDIEVTNSSGDGGIDVRGTLVVGDAVRIRMAVQAKRWKSNVQAPVVQQVRGSLGAHEQGLIITTSDFSRGAKIEATRSDAAPVALISGEQLAALLAKHQIGARAESYELYTLDAIESAGE